MKLMIIDASINALTLLSNNLEIYGYQVQGALDISLAHNVVQIGYQPEIVMVNISLYSAPYRQEIQQLLSAINNPYLFTIAISDIESETARMRALSMGFQGYISKPFNIKAILAEIERIARLGATPSSLLAPEGRRWPRFRVVIPVKIEVTDEETNEICREQTMTEDISQYGASVLTMLQIRVGTIISLTMVESEAVTMALVKGCFIGSDRMRRLNLEMLNKMWQEIFTRATTPQVPPSLMTPSLEEDQLTLGILLKGRYRLDSILGKGGLGIVYKAMDIKSHCPVAVKVLLEIDGNNSREGIARAYFEREIQILRAVNHANIVSIIDSGTNTKGQPFLVMDYIEGTPLNLLISAGNGWSVARTLHLLKQLCPALAAMHNQNIIHRDLKPANIIIKEPGKAEIAILLDLGIAKVVRGSNESSLIKSITRTGMIVGTISYISPEQCLESDVDEGADIYALGIVTYELLTGRLPFQATSVGGLLLAQIQAPPAPLHRFVPDINKEIEQVVLWALAKQREDRPKTMLEFLEAFRIAAGDIDNTQAAPDLINAIKQASSEDANGNIREDTTTISVKRDS